MGKWKEKYLNRQSLVILREFSTLEKEICSSKYYSIFIGSGLGHLVV